MTDAEKIAELVAQKIQPTIPVDIDLWSAREIAAYLKVSPRQALERYSHLPDFPKPIRLPVVVADGSKPGKGHSRWVAKEVIAWALKHQLGEQRGPGRPRKAS